MPSKQTIYRGMELARDPDGIRSAWIIETLATRPRSSSELLSAAERNGLGFAKSTYTRDLRGLLLKRLVWKDGRGTYGAEPNGVLWAEQYRKDNAA